MIKAQDYAFCLQQHVSALTRAVAAALSSKSSLLYRIGRHANLLRCVRCCPTSSCIDTWNSLFRICSTAMFALQRCVLMRKPNRV